MASSWTLGRRAAAALNAAEAATSPQEREHLLCVAADLNQRALLARIEELEHERRQARSRREPELELAFV